MLANEPTWTVERIELLKNRFEAGLTCREIACDIGVSRKARRRTTHRAKECREGTRPLKNGTKAPISAAAGAVRRA